MKGPFSNENFEKLSELILKYLEVKSELIQIQVKEQVFQIISSLLFAIGLIVFAFLILIMLSIGVSQYLNQWLDSSYLGYFVVTAFDTVIFIVVLFNRKRIIKRGVMNIIAEDHFEHEKSKEDAGKE